MINTGGTFSSQLPLPPEALSAATGSTYYSKQSTKNLFKIPVKNGHILPIPNPTTGAINVTNDGVTGNGGYWYKNQCYMSGMSFNMAIGSGMGALTGGPTFVSATTSYHGYYTGFATGNVYLYSACCQHKISDTIPVSSLSSSKSPTSARNSNDYLVKGSFVYSGDGTTASCYLTSGNTYDTLIDNPDSPGYDSHYQVIFLSIIYIIQEQITLLLRLVTLLNLPYCFPIHLKYLTVVILVLLRVIVYRRI